MKELNRRGFLGWVASGASALLLPSQELIRPRPVVFDMGRNLRTLALDPLREARLRALIDPVKVEVLSEFGTLLATLKADPASVGRTSLGGDAIASGTPARFRVVRNGAPSFEMTAGVTGDCDVIFNSSISLGGRVTVDVGRDA